MKFFVSMASLLACAFSLNAQITAVLERVPGHSSMTAAAESVPEIKIRNTSNVNLTAFAISLAPMDADSTPFLFYLDSAVDDHFRKPYQLPLPPTQEYVVDVPIRLMTSGQLNDVYKEPVVTAGVFADGTTEGDPILLTRLILRRCSMLQAVELAHDILSNAAKHNVPPPQLIEQFRMIANSLNHWYVPTEQQVGRTIYQSIMEKLMDLPPLQVGSPFPPTTFVEQETVVLNRQRAVLLNSRPNIADVALGRK
jgi:hypothetical protein